MLRAIEILVDGGFTAGRHEPIVVAVIGGLGIEEAYSNDQDFNAGF